MGKRPITRGAFDITLFKRSIIVADRFYNDFSLFNVWNSNSVFLMSATKETLGTPPSENELSNNRHSTY